MTSNSGDSSLNTIHLRAPAKLNLGLAVLGSRPDGFHQIETLFARLELHDEVWLEPAPTVSGELLRDEAGEAEVRLHGLLMNSENLALRAAAAYFRATGVNEGVDVRLLKRIPVAAGLGGGSSDAASVLLGLARLYPSSLDLYRLAHELGSDVPFFLSERAAAWAGGRGELLEPAELPRLRVVLLNPGVTVSAADAYRRLRRFDPPLERKALLRQLAGIEEPVFKNSLQPGVEEGYPVVVEALAALRSAGLRGVLMSGSGPTCFGLAQSDEQAEEAVDLLRRRYPHWWISWGGAAV
ncbi:MAG: 4-(cytidine 5'-diphospho)-2-C-methyl-D-erythritol kinase [Trueperaceae bacterium]